MLNRDLELTRRIDDEDAAAIELELSKLENVEASIEQLVKALNEGQWKDSSIVDPKMPYIALLAYQNNCLSLDDFSTLLIYWSARQLHGEALRPLTPKDPEFKKIISATLVPRIPKDNKEFRESAPNLLTLKAQYSSQFTSAQLEEFFAGIEKLPESQQVIFAFNETIDLVELGKSANVTDKLTTLNFSSLGRSQILYRAVKQLAAMSNPAFGAALKPEVTSMIPSLGLMRLYPKVKFGDQAVSINPVLGLSALADIRQNALSAMRDMALHFPHIKLPDMADGFSAPWLHFTWHDFYHVFSSSAVPVEHQKLFVGLSDAIKEYSTKNTLSGAEAKTIDDFANALIDMEHSLYRSLFTLLKLNMADESLPVIFMLTLTFSLSKYLQPYSSAKQSSGDKDAPPQLSEETTRGLFKVICEFIRDKKEFGDLMSANYKEAIYRNFTMISGRNAHPKDIARNDRLFSTFAQLSSGWRSMCASSPALFVPQPAIGLKTPDTKNVTGLHV